MRKHHAMPNHTDKDKNYNKLNYPTKGNKLMSEIEVTRDPIVSYLSQIKSVTNRSKDHNKIMAERKKSKSYIAKANDFKREQKSIHHIGKKLPQLMNSVCTNLRSLGKHDQEDCGKRERKLGRRPNCSNEGWIKVRKMKTMKTFKKEVIIRKDVTHTSPEGACMRKVEKLKDKSKDSSL